MARRATIGDRASFRWVIVGAKTASNVKVREGGGHRAFMTAPRCDPRLRPALQSPRFRRELRGGGDAECLHRS